jgi:hypothetical protein
MHVGSAAESNARFFSSYRVNRVLVSVHCCSRGDLMNTYYVVIAHHYVTHDGHDSTREPLRLSPSRSCTVTIGHPEHRKNRSMIHTGRIQTTGAVYTVCAVGAWAYFRGGGGAIALMNSYLRN